MNGSLPRVVKVLLVITLAAAASGLLQAQLPQAVGTWLARGAVADARVGAASTALEDGRTLIAGGWVVDGSVTDSVVVYDPVSNETTATGQLIAPRVNASATLLADGRVLVVGGLVGGVPSGDVEIFDLATGRSTLAASLAEARAWHASARLFDDSVLIVGGAAADGTALASAEIFDPGTGSIYPAGAMTTPRMGASATALIDHRVLIAGGHDGAQDLATAEIYDAYTSAFTVVPTLMAAARSGHTAVLLPHNAGVLLAGGTAAGTAVTSTDLFVPAIFPDPYSWGMGSFAATAAMTAPRAFAVGGPLGDNGFAYVAGGGFADAEAYRFATLKTDKDDYAPGELATITGSGWQPGETVALTFQEDPAVHDDYSFTVTADANGNIYWDQWAPEEHDLNVRFYLTAQGTVSRAQTTFTDGRAIISVTLNGSSSVTVNPGETIGATVTVTTDGSGANSRWRSTAWRIASAPGTMTCIDHANEDTVGTFSRVLSITAPGPPGTYSAYFTAHADDGCGPGGGGASGLFTMTAAVVVAAPDANTTTSAGGAAATYGDPSVSLAATVSAPSTTVNVGTVTFTVKQGATTIGSATTSGTVTAGSASVAYALPAGTEAGSYTVEASYSGGTGFSASAGVGALTIGQKLVTVVTQPASKIYGAADPSPLTTADLSVFLAADAITATFDRAAGDTVGPYAITTTLVDPNSRLSNYAITNAGATFAINARPVTVTTQAAGKIYGDADPDPLTTADLSAFLAADAITATFARASGETVGPYAITTTLVDPNGRLSNYTVTNTGATFTIDVKPVTVITQPASKTYGDADPDPLTTADLSAFLAADGITATFARAPGNTVGPYAITTTLVDPNSRLGNYTVTNAGATFTINQRTLIVTASGADRLYDGTVIATVTLFHNALSGDDVTVGYGVATFADRNVANGKSIEVTGISITGGADSANYTLDGVTTATASANVTVRPLSISAAPDSRVYNGTTSSTAIPTVGTVYSPDSVTGLVQTFDTKNVGTGKTLSVSGYVVNDGNGGNNYVVTTVPDTTGVITQLALTVTGITANNKPFDGNTTATLNLGGATLVGAVSGDSVTLNTAGAVGTFSSAAVGSNLTVFIAGLSLAGADQGNYSLTQPTTTASITAWSLTGFYSPVGIPNTYAGTPPLVPGVWNTIKGGQTVPFKFNLYTTAGGTELTSVSSVQSFSLALLACTTGAEDPVEPDFATTGATSLRYGDGQFIQNWATPKGANRCYRVTMMAADGSTLSAFFKTK